MPAFGQTAVFIKPIRLHVDTILNCDVRLGEVAEGNVMDMVWPKGVTEIEIVAVPKWNLREVVLEQAIQSVHSVQT